MAEEVTSWEEKAAYYKEAIEKLVAESGPIYLAVVDDGPFTDTSTLEALFKCKPLELTISNKMGDPDAHIIIQEFPSVEEFLLADIFDICILDGNFGYGLRTGPQSISIIRTEHPGIRIIGRTAEPELNEQFKGEVDELIPKNPKTGSIPQNLDKILDVMLSIGERSYQDPSKMSLEELIRTQ